MWWRFLTFCVLVSFILFIVASCIYGRPSFHLFFHRCCGTDIENDQVIFENFGNNFLKERLVGGDIIEADNETVSENEDIGRITDDINDVLSINDPEVKKWIADIQLSDSVTSDIITEDKIEVKQISSAMRENKEEKNKGDVKKYEPLEKNINDVTETASTLHDVDAEDTILVEQGHDTVRNLKQKEENRLDKTDHELLKKDTEEVTESVNHKEFLNVHDWKHKRIARTI